MYGDTMHPSIYPSETHSPSLLNIAPRHLRLTCIFRNICRADYKAISDHLVPLRWCSHTVTFPAQHDRGILVPGRWPPSTVTFSAVRSRSEFLLSPHHSIVTNEKENRKELCSSCLLLTVGQPPSGAAAAASSNGVSFSPSGTAAIIDHRCYAPPQPNSRKDLILQLSATLPPRLLMNPMLCWCVKRMFDGDGCLKVRRLKVYILPCMLLSNWGRCSLEGKYVGDLMAKMYFENGGTILDVNYSLLKSLI
ncbi:uncharacterized protein LOC125195064 [Salvia hispanica]|uniref:uncharacterized protein LOC125195064 n=1 Tax=Salvia hispanica TaxID=49212 RepID=UPI002009BD64|nr:uncharacterized protein LOC125195064 [Salvia hispanica]